MHFFNRSSPIRFAIIIILLAHSLPGMFDGGVQAFGEFYLNKELGLAPFGHALAWAIKLSHIAAAICFAVEKFVKPAAIATIGVLLAGIVLLHGPEGWYVVGGGRNGMEFNFLLIFALISVMFPDGFGKKS